MSQSLKMEEYLNLILLTKKIHNLKKNKEENIIYLRLLNRILFKMRSRITQKSKNNRILSRRKEQIKQRPFRSNEGNQTKKLTAKVKIKYGPNQNNKVISYKKKT